MFASKAESAKPRKYSLDFFLRQLHSRPDCFLRSPRRKSSQIHRENHVLMEGVKLGNTWKSNIWLSTKSCYLKAFIWARSLLLQIQSVLFLVLLYYRSVPFVSLSLPRGYIRNYYVFIRTVFFLCKYPNQDPKCWAHKIQTFKDSTARKKKPPEFFPVTMVMATNDIPIRWLQAM